MNQLLFLFVIAHALICASVQTAEAQNTAPYWSLAGNSNAGSSPRIGNTTAIPLHLVTNNSTRMFISPVAGNVGIGTTSPLQRLDVNGNINLAKGFGLYMENRRVLRVDSAINCVFLGNGTGMKNTGSFNTATGSYALYSNFIANNNTATGAFSLYSTVSGGGNVANGFKALYYNTSGIANTAVGITALYANTEGRENVAAGAQALGSNRTGSYNTAAGSGALYFSVSGTYNAALGNSALLNNVSGNENVAIGSYALDATKDASSNTAVGHLAGHYFQNGWNNTFIGSYARADRHGIYNSVALGNGATVTAPNQVRIGNSYSTSIGGYTSWTNISDGRVKRNIQDNVPGLAFINKLKPVTYNLDMDAVDKILIRPAAKDKDGKPLVKALTQTELAARVAKQQAVYTGFIAQEVEKAAKELGYDFSGVDVARKEGDLYGLRYAEFVIPLVKAVQELSNENEELKKRLDKLERTINNKQVNAKSPQATEITGGDGALLQQNTPNPAKGKTRIAYTLPGAARHAQLLLTDGTGKVLRTVSLTTSGVVDIDTAGLNSGVYNYSLVVDYRTIATRRLIVAR